MSTSISCSQRQAPKSAIKNSSIFNEAEVKAVLISKNNTKVYSGASHYLPIIAILNKGDIVKVMGSYEDWYGVILKNNQIGCILKEMAVPYVEGKDLKENLVIEDDLLPEEKQLLDLVNQERKKADLNPLVVDLSLTKLARLKSQDLITNEYFNHYSPTYGSPFEMMKKFNISYVFAGENLAGNKTVKGAHFSLMESTTHRQNILHPSFTHVGIGMKEGGEYGRIFTQLFLGR